MSHDKTTRPRKVAAVPTPFEQARDELFQHIMSSGVVGSIPDHQKEWFDETMGYMAQRYHELSAVELADLRTLGERFAQPARSGQAISA